MNKRIPTGIVNYEVLIKNNYYTVDKTLMIRDFVERGSAVTLITRPRRFGKTSNMSMLAAFFDINKTSIDVFKNTNIAKTEYISEMNQYPVIFLSFANCKGEFDYMMNQFFDILLKVYDSYQNTFDDEKVSEGLRLRIMKTYHALQAGVDLVEIPSSLRTLSEVLYKVYGKRAMIFIDEYDTPFIEAHVKGYYEKVRGVLSSLLHNTLKDNDDLQYAMLTGIQRVAKENIFSDLNNLEVFTVKDKEYAQYFGFTKYETQEFLEYYGLALNNDVKSMYDGYNMGGIDIYNPWSIINYGKRQELVPYWVNTSSNTMIKQAMKQSNQSFKDGYETLIVQGYLDTQVSMETSFYEDNGTSNLWGLFVNAGYLTVDKAIDSWEDEYRLRIPNQEVTREFKALTANHLHVQMMELNDLYKSIKAQDQDKFYEAYKKLLLKNPSYHDLKSENSYHMFMLGICLYISDDYSIISNRESGKGRCDLVLKAKDNGTSFVIEFRYCAPSVKYTKFKEQLEDLSLQGIQQIKEQRYDADLTGKIIYISLAHCGKEVEMNWESK